MKDIRVEARPLTFPLLSEELSEFTFPAMKTSLLTLLLHVPQLPASQIASLYATDYHLAVLMTKKFLQFMAHLTPAPHHHRIPWILQSLHQPSPSTPYMLTSKKIKISKQLH